MAMDDVVVVGGGAQLDRGGGVGVREEGVDARGMDARAAHSVDDGSEGPYELRGGNDGREDDVVFSRVAFGAPRDGGLGGEREREEESSVARFDGEEGTSSGKAHEAWTIERASEGCPSRGGEGSVEETLENAREDGAERVARVVGVAGSWAVNPSRSTARRNRPTICAWSASVTTTRTSAAAGTTSVCRARDGRSFAPPELSPARANAVSRNSDTATWSCSSSCAQRRRRASASRGARRRTRRTARSSRGKMTVPASAIPRGSWAGIARHQARRGVNPASDAAEDTAQSSASCPA